MKICKKFLLLSLALMISLSVIPMGCSSAPVVEGNKSAPTIDTGLSYKIFADRPPTPSVQHLTTYKNAGFTHLVMTEDDYTFTGDDGVITSSYAGGLNACEDVGLLEIAQNKASKVVVQSVLPAREELFPNQAWLDEDKWALNSDIEIFNQKLLQLCSEFNVVYLDTYSEFCTKNLAERYIDAVHLNKVGQQELAKIYRKIV